MIFIFHVSAFLIICFWTFPCCSGFKDFLCPYFRKREKKICLILCIPIWWENLNKLNPDVIMSLWFDSCDSFEGSTLNKAAVKLTLKMSLNLLAGAVVLDGLVSFVLVHRQNQTIELCSDADGYQQVCHQVQLLCGGCFKVFLAGFCFLEIQIKQHLI